MQNLGQAYAADIRIRLADEKLAPEGIAVAVEEFGHGGVVHEQGGVRMTAFRVDHGEAIKPAFGYRVDHGERSVVISGDTRYCENVILHGRGADLLIHSVGAVRPELADDSAALARGLLPTHILFCCPGLACLR
jgi:ribonuclease Z